MTRTTGYAVINYQDHILSPVYVTYEQACGDLLRRPVGLGLVVNAIYDNHVVGSPNYHEFT